MSIARKAIEFILSTGFNGRSGFAPTREVRKDEPTTNTLLGSPGSASDDALAEAQRIAANEPNLNDDEYQALIRAIEARRTREKGKAPPQYTHTTICQHCGPVPIFPGVGEQIEGCPWCFNRVAGLPVPRPQQETYRDCGPAMLLKSGCTGNKPSDYRPSRVRVGTDGDGE